MARTGGASPGSGPVSLSSWKSTWKSDEWLRLRSGCSASTSRSSGTSWFSKAPSTVSRTRPTSSRKVGLPDRSPRSTSVFMNSPTTPCTSARERPAEGVPTTTSSLPV